MTKTYVLYHGNCTDGFGAAWAAWRRFGNEAEYIPVSYGLPVPAMDPWSEVYILDFSYPRETLLELSQTHALVHVEDHHKTAQEALAGLDFCHFDMNRSGAVLAWKYFFRIAPVPQLLKYIEDRDLWRFDLTDSREISAWLSSFPFDFELWTRLVERVELGDISSIEEGAAILRAKNQAVENMARHSRKMRLGDHVVPVANATVYFSEVGERLCELYPDAPFAAYFLLRADHMVQWGLRSRNGFDVSEVAKLYGGGGHPGAAGFVTDSIALMEIG
jgi:oligoribonuclease NrnB/cAMP/cGMP phosphodiesterase (DHH superfamily)